MKIFLLFVFLLSANVSLAEKMSYEGYKVFRLTPTTQSHIHFLKNLSQTEGVMFWDADGPSKLMRSANVMISPAQQTKLVAAIRESGINIVETIGNVQKLIDAESVTAVADTQNSNTAFYFNKYHRLDAIYDFLDTLVEAHSDIASIINIGYSFENRELRVIKIGKPGEGRNAIWLDANIHGREWIAGAVATYFINELLTNPEYATWTDDFDFYILPYANPDGYEFTHTGNRLWRMTRSTGHSEDPTCVGVDPNRNFDYRWMDGGASDDPCHEQQNYAGPRAFSENETIALAEFVTTISEEMVFFGSIHCYSNMILMPYGLEDITLPEEEKNDYMRIAKRMEKAILDLFGTYYVSGSIFDIFYEASGSTMDWAKGTFNTFLTLSFELRPGPEMSDVGNLLPPDEIVPTSLEFIAAFGVIIDELRAEFINRNPRFAMF